MPQAYGSDRASAGSENTWTLDAAHTKGWRARRPATRTTPEHPGTAVDWDGSLWEVVGAAPAGAGVRYTLAPWEDRHTIRLLQKYDAGAEERRIRDRADQGFRDRTRRLLLLLSPIAGHAPAEVQERWEREYDVSGSLMTMISAFPLFVFGFVSAFSLAIRYIAGSVLLPLPEKVLFFGIYLFVESGFRLSVAWSQGQPAGSLAGAIVWEIVRRVRSAAARASGGPGTASRSSR
jgi:hypothetical protein